MKDNDLFKGNSSTESEIEMLIAELEDIAEESGRAARVAGNLEKHINEIEAEFNAQTGFNKVDTTFLMMATMLQCVRQYLLTSFPERVDDKTAAKNTKGYHETHSNRNYKLYNPSLEDIINNPVPFDAIMGSPKFNIKIGGGFNHRAKTLGHDPILGWLFGTANIATGTLTTCDFQSYHIKTGSTKNNFARDEIYAHASTERVFQHTKDKLLKSGTEGKIIIGTSLIQEAIHLKSDIGTFASLPIPIVSTFSPEMARELADYGLDMANVLSVGKQSSWAIVINSIIAMVHRLFYDKNSGISASLYEVKTRNILSYSNLIASTSNILATAIRSYIGDAKALKTLDVGGILVTIYRLLNDSSNIYRIKEEFIISEFSKLVNNG